MVKKHSFQFHNFLWRYQSYLTYNFKLIFPDLYCYKCFVEKWLQFSNVIEQDKNTHPSKIAVKVHIFWEGHKILRNLHQLFVLCTASQIIGGDFAKFCGLLRMPIWTLPSGCWEFPWGIWVTYILNFSIQD